MGKLKGEDQVLFLLLICINVVVSLSLQDIVFLCRDLRAFFKKNIDK